jgi:hypothetical protein
MSFASPPEAEYESIKVPCDPIFGMGVILAKLRGSVASIPNIGSRWAYGGVSNISPFEPGSNIKRCEIPLCGTSK